MRRPRLHYLIGLSRKMGKPIGEVLTWPQEEMVLQMAYDLSQNPDFIAQCEKDAVLAMSDEERVRHDKAVLMRLFA